MARPPDESLLWSGSRRWVVAAVMLTAGLGAAQLAVTCIATLILAIPTTAGSRCSLTELGQAALYAGLPALLSAAWHAWLCAKRLRSLAEATHASYLYGLVAGPLAVTLSLGLLFLTEPPSSTTNLFHKLVEVFIGGTMMGVVVGLIGAMLHTKLIRFGCTATAAHDATDRAGLVCGGWLAGVSLICLLPTTLSFASPGALFLGHLALFAISAPLATAGLLLRLRARRRLERRRRWLAEVRCGKAPGWHLLPLDEATAELARGLRPLFHAHRPPKAASLLAREVADDERGAYRTGALRLLPVAVVDAHQAAGSEERGLLS